MNKETEIKNVNEFYKGLKNKIANLFNLYDKAEMFEGMTEKQKRTIFEFGCACLSEVYNPIQKRYTKQERKKAELKLKKIRHEVYEEIRNQLMKYIIEENGYSVIEICDDRLELLLHQIEQGESNGQ